MAITTSSPFKEESFSAYVERVAPTGLPVMPLFHVTTIERLKLILEAEKITPLLCKSMGCERVYAFYGRPAYRPQIERDEDLDPAIQSSEEAELSNRFLFPVCLGLKPKLIKEAVGLFPFDTGAFMSKRFSKYISVDGDAAARLKRCLAFKLSNIDNISDHFVTAFYGDNDDYYYLSVKDILSLETESDDVLSYHGLIRSDSPSKELDNRRGALEVQFDKAIDISNHNIDFAILPRAAASLHKYINFFQTRNIPIVPYLDIKGKLDDHLTSMINAAFYFMEKTGAVPSLSGSIAKAVDGRET